MKKPRFTDEQIIGFLRQAEEGIPIKDIGSGMSLVLSVALMVDNSDAGATAFFDSRSRISVSRLTALTTDLS